MKDGQNILQLATPQELLKIAQCYFNFMALYANVERFFP